jgi:hypothetical protein
MEDNVAHQVVGPIDSPRHEGTVGNVSPTPWGDREQPTGRESPVSSLIEPVDADESSEQKDEQEQESGGDPHESGRPRRASMDSQERAEEALMELERKELNAARALALEAAAELVAPPPRREGPSVMGWAAVSANQAL